jgi:hypothetical protein
VLDDVKLSVTQEVVVIPGEQTGLPDTCLVRYALRNGDDRPHRVGLRFLLDTFIGGNDGVPFLIPGQRELCDTMLKFDRLEAIPDFIQALERQDLEDPGTVAHLQLRLGKKLESPSRLTLGAWPDGELTQRGLTDRARAQLTGWDVPVLPIRALADALPGAPPDSAVTIYWDPKPLAAGDRRELGFTYGLGSVAGGEGKGKLALTVGGSFRPGGEFTLTAYVQGPVKGQTVTLELPEGFSLAEGDAEQPVPPPAEGARRTSPVTWKVRAANSGGNYSLKVVSSTGVSQTKRVTIQSNRLFD